MFQHIGSASGSGKGVAENITCGKLSAAGRRRFQEEVDLPALVSHIADEVVVHVARSCHASLNAHAAERAFKAVSETADILLTAIQFDVVVVAENHEIAIDFRILIESAARMKVAPALHRVVETVSVAADEIVVPDHRVAHDVHHDGFRSGGVSVSPAVRASQRIVDVVALDEQIVRIFQIDCGVVVESVETLRKLSGSGVETSVEIKPLNSGASPAGYIAIGDPDMRGFFHMDCIGHAAPDDQTVKQNILCIADIDHGAGRVVTEILLLERRLFRIGQDESRFDRVTDPAVRRPLIIDRQMPVEVFLIQNDCFRNRDRSAQSTELSASVRKSFSIGGPQLKLVSGILLQINDAAAKLRFFEVVNRRKPGDPFFRSALPDIRQHILSGCSGPVIRTSAKQRNQLQFRFRRSGKRRNQHKAKDKKAFHVHSCLLFQRKRSVSQTSDRDTESFRSRRFSAVRIIPAQMRMPSRQAFPPSERCSAFCCPHDHLRKEHSTSSGGGNALGCRYIPAEENAGHG